MKESSRSISSSSDQSVDEATCLSNGDRESVSDSIDESAQSPALPVDDSDDSDDVVAPSELAVEPIFAPKPNRISRRLAKPDSRPSRLNEKPVSKPIAQPAIIPEETDSNEAAEALIEEVPSVGDGGNDSQSATEISEYEESADPPPSTPVAITEFGDSEPEEAVIASPLTANQRTSDESPPNRSGVHTTFATIWQAARLGPTEITQFESDAEELSHFVDSEVAEQVEPFPNPFRHPIRATIWTVRTAFGIASLFFLLAIIAAIPLVNILAIGYMLEVQGRLGRRGRLRDAFPLLDKAPRIGSIAIGVWLWVFPLRLLSDAAADARLIDPGSAAATNLHRLTIVAAFAVAIHLCLALARGGGFWCFFRPLKNLLWFIRKWRETDYLEYAASHIRKFVAGMRLPHYFALGFRGLVATFAWLVIPTALFAFSNNNEGISVLVTLYGGYVLLLLFTMLPFMQARFAAENRLGAMFELGTILHLFTRAPITWMFAAIIMYLFALPLYLLKVALPPQDAMWLVTMVFVGSIWPAKVVVGWAYHRAVKKMLKDETARRSLWWYARRLIIPAVCLVLMVAAIFFFVFLSFFTQYIGEQGKWVLFEHHAFLLPGATLGPATVAVCVLLVALRYLADKAYRRWTRPNSASMLAERPA